MNQRSCESLGFSQNIEAGVKLGKERNAEGTGDTAALPPADVAEKTTFKKKTVLTVKQTFPECSQSVLAANPGL